MNPFLILGGIKAAQSVLGGVSSFFAQRREADDIDAQAEIQGAQNDLAADRYKTEYGQQMRELGLGEQSTLGTMQAGFAASGVKGGSTKTTMLAAGNEFSRQRTDAKTALDLGMKSVDIGRMQERRMGDAADVKRRQSWWSLVGAGVDAAGTAANYYDAYQKDTGQGYYA